MVEADRNLFQQKRERYLVLGLLVGVLLLTFAAAVGIYLQHEYPTLEDEESLFSNVTFFFLINLNIIAVMVLGFLVARNLVKLVLDRRRKILGAKLRSRLVTAFVGLSLIPTALLFLVAKGMLERGFDEWFSPQISSAVDGALGVARYHYDSAESETFRRVYHLSRKVAEFGRYLNPSLLIDPQTPDQQLRKLLTDYLEEKREEAGLFELSLVTADGSVLATATSLELRYKVVDLPSVNMAALWEVSNNESTLVRPEQSINGEFLRGYAPIALSDTAVINAGWLLAKDGLVARGEAEELPVAELESGIDQPPGVQYVLVGTHWVLPELSRALGSVLNAYDDYKELRTYRKPLASSYFLTLVVVTLLIVFAAIWVGFYLARDLSIPIGLLATGTQEVAHGNLDHYIPELGDDELSVLVKSFNTMTKDLKETTGELVSRRRYMETILASVGVGVVSIDTASIITTCNEAAAEMLGLESCDSCREKNIHQVLPGPLAELIDNLAEQQIASGRKVITDALVLDAKSGSKHLQLNLTQLVDERGQALGAVLLLDDMTELVSAQRMAAWQEVARRIAHEIKNPLTPIQLSAERLQRKFGRSGVLGKPLYLGEKEREIITESTETIVNQVESLRNLVNEFWQFARMPKSSPRQADLNEVIRETVAIYRDTHGEICFELILAQEVPKFALDPEQINRVLINLIDNSISSIYAAAGDREVPKPEVKSATERALKSMTSLFSVAGVGGREEKELEPVEIGRIVISTRFDAQLGMVSIELSDTGVGVREQDRKKLFDPYYSTKRGGSGLGLAIVSTIISDHHGFIRVRDNQPCGACFVIELPVSRDVLLKRA